jgi:predicted  nucleic acid-binding Zn-ribbon protein
MNREKLNLSLSNLERKVKFLLNNYKDLKQELTIAKSENQELKEIIRKKDDQIIDFQNKYKISKIVTNIRDGEDDASELKNQINEYIREIDKCIMHLSQG